jgi:hypothetical protein
VHRRVFEAGVWFDEAMRDGYEDWEFWQRAAARGFRGRHAPWVGFRYRRRPESMLAGSDRMREALVEAIARRSRAAWRVRRALAVEHAETPRYALVVAGGEPAVGLASDPNRWAHEMSLVVLARLIAAWSADPRRWRAPPYVAVLERARFDDPSWRRLLPGRLWRAEALADAGQPTASDGLAFVSTAQLLAGELPASEVLSRLRETLNRLQAAPAQRWIWRTPSTQPSSAAHLGLRHLAGGGPVLPLAGDKPCLSVAAAAWPPQGFAAAAAGALATAARGWSVHLMLGAEPAAADERFDSVNFMGEVDRAGDSAYFGAALPPASGAEARMVGLFCGMDAVLNLGVHPLSPVMGRLGALGVRRWLALPEERDAPPWDLALAFEHCYEAFFARDTAIAERARAAGIPAAKIAVGEGRFP